MQLHELVPERLVRQWERWFERLSPEEHAPQRLGTRTFVSSGAGHTEHHTGAVVPTREGTWPQRVAKCLLCTLHLPEHCMSG